MMTTENKKAREVPSATSEIVCEFVRVLASSDRPSRKNSLTRRSVRRRTVLEPKNTTKRSRGGFMNVLWQYIDRTETFDRDVVIPQYTTKRYVCVVDKYPKARTHLLLLPRRDTGLCVDKIDRLTRSSVAELRDFHAHAMRIVEDIVRSSRGSMSSKDIQVGYHAIPSLRPLHLHIISRDFVSSRMKTKKHWNSFTTDFFVSPKTVESLLSSSDDASCIFARTSILRSALKTPLRCHRCLRPQRNMPTLKSHILTCSGVGISSSNGAVRQH